MMYEGLSVAIIGAGRWGMNHVKTASSFISNSNIWVCDDNMNVGDKVSKISPDIHFTTDLNDILSNTEINSVIVATPAHLHYQITKKILNAGKHV